MNNNLILAIRGPIILIVVGTLFALDHFTEFTVVRTWPVLLIAGGLLALLRGPKPARIPPAPYQGYPRVHVSPTQSYPKPPAAEPPPPPVPGGAE
ncbi:MAG: LiaI-LiaF-like domain-containing protein [Bryobacteraceae bacterium]